MTIESLAEHSSGYQSTIEENPLLVAVKSATRETHLLGQSILDSSQFQAGDRLYLYASPESIPLVAELKMADSALPLPELLKKLQRG